VSDDNSEKRTLLMQFSTFTNKRLTTAYPLNLCKERFIETFAKHHVRPDKDGKLFAPATFNDTRSNGNFLSASGICLDFDNGQPSVESVLELFPGTLAVYHSTHSHTLDNPRFRVVVPLSRLVDVKEHARLILGVKSTIPLELMECIDLTCFERARSHYLPSCPPEQERHAFTGHQDGAPMDADRFISMGAVADPVEEPEQKIGQPHASEELGQRAYEYTDPATGEVHDLFTWAAQNPGFDIVAAIDPHHRHGKLKDGKQHITCPFEDQHTDQGKDTATFAANASLPQFAAWDAHCCHAHCVGRDRLEYLHAMLENGWISVSHLQVTTAAVIELRRPPKIYYPTNDVLAAPEWSTLLGHERRIALDLMTMMWAEDDGAMADDDWSIARRLGIPEKEWMSYRETLNRAGWLLESEGRLTNAIVKDQFDKAQAAYMAVIGRAGAGGRATQVKARQTKNKHTLEAHA
jgi:hypothetical protein